MVSRSSTSLSTQSAQLSTPSLKHSCSNSRSNVSSAQHTGTSLKWIFARVVLAGLLLFTGLLNLQIMTHYWNVADCRFSSPTQMGRSTGSGSGCTEATSNHYSSQGSAEDLSVPTNVTLNKPKARQRLPVELHSKGATSLIKEILPKEQAEQVTIPLMKPRKRRWKGNGAMRHFAYGYFRDTNIYCDAMAEERQNDSSIPLTMEISFGCDEAFRRSGYGTGNYISFLYGVRLASAVHTNVGLNLTCYDATTTSKDLVLPWLTGWFPPRSTGSENPFPKVSTGQACNLYQNTQIFHMYREMQYDFRRMAIGLVGLPEDPNHPSHKFAQTFLGSSTNVSLDSSVRQLVVIPNEPVFPKGSVKLDDAVIHFRCGDLMDSDHANFAFLKFDGYTQDISTAASSIGIVTQQFSQTKLQTDSGVPEIVAIDPATVGQVRAKDANATTQDRCRTVVLALVDFILVRHPQSRVTVHNGPTETIALAYARMVMANQTIAGSSSFAVFPLLSSFGTGYYHHPHGPFGNGWMFELSELASNLHLVRDKDHIMVADVKKLWETQGADGVVAWFKDNMTNATSSQSS